MVVPPVRVCVYGKVIWFVLFGYAVLEVTKLISMRFTRSVSIALPLIFTLAITYMVVLKTLGQLGVSDIVLTLIFAVILALVIEKYNHQ